MQQKVSIIILVALLAGGCSLRSDSYGIKTTDILGRDQLGDLRYSEADIMQKINGLKGDGVQSSNNEQVAGEQAANVQLENLAATYDRAIVRTSLGNITIQFFVADAPITINNFMNLAQKGFYDGTTFHRVIKDFMIQGGDPNSKDDDWSNDGTGGPGYYFNDEINAHKLVRGALAMANAGPNTNGSQFFIVTKSETPWLDGKHTVFGEVIEGMDVVAAIEGVEVNENDHPLEDVSVLGIDLFSSKDSYELSPEEQAEVEAVNGEAGAAPEVSEETATSSEE